MANNNFECWLRSNTGTEIWFWTAVDLTPEQKGDLDLYHTPIRSGVRVRARLSQRDNEGAECVTLSFSNSCGEQDYPDVKMWRIGTTNDFEAVIGKHIYMMERNKITSLFRFFDQYATFTVNRQNGEKTQICPVNGTPRFRTTFYSAFRLQCVKSGSAVLIRPGARNFDNRNEIFSSDITSRTWLVDSVGALTGNEVSGFNKRVFIGTPACNCGNRSRLNKAVSVNDVILVNVHHQVRFNANGGSPTEQFRAIHHGHNVGTLPTVRRDRHNFVQWEASNGSRVTPNTAVTSCVTYNARWKRIHFLPNPDGYGFVNQWDSFGYQRHLPPPPTSMHIIPLDRFVRVYGAVLGWFYYRAYNYYSDGSPRGWRGNCFGMATSSGAFYSKLMDVTSYGANRVFDIAAPRNRNHRVTELIETFQVSSFLDNVLNFINRDIRGAVNAARQYCIDGKRLVAFVVWSDAMETSPSGVSQIRTISHTLIPYCFEENSREFRFEVYDCNRPGLRNQWLVINKDFKTWSYPNDTRFSSAKSNACFAFFNVDLIGIMMRMAFNLPISDEQRKLLSPFVPVIEPDGSTIGAIGAAMPENFVCLSVSLREVDIYNSKGVHVDNIKEARELSILDGGACDNIILSLPSDAYHVVPKTDSSEAFEVSLTDYTTCVSLCHASPFEVTIALGEKPQLEIEKVSGDFDLHIVTTNENLSKDKVAVFKGKRTKQGKNKVGFNSENEKKGKQKDRTMDFKFKI
jgi:hypothetical protein